MSAAVGQPAFGVDCCGASGAGSGDRLTVRVIDQVTGSEDAVDGGRGGTGSDAHVSGVVEIDLALDELAARVVADGDEHAGDLECGGLTRDGVTNDEPGDAVLAEDLDGLRVGQEADLLVGLGALEHDP